MAPSPVPDPPVPDRVTSGPPVEQCGAVVVGGGPAGLAAAEALVAAGHRPLICEAMPTVGRKFLMAGKSGLNLTRAEDPDRFARAYGPASARLAPMLAAFGPAEAVAWAEALGEAMFAGSSGRVFPVAMKASPLLRRWLARLAAGGAEIRTRWRWTGWDGGVLCFDTPAGPRRLLPRATVLALGGGSWPRLGSDGAWTERLVAAGVPLTPLAPANMGFDVAWSAHFAERFAGHPVKPVRLSAGGRSVRGEMTITRTGIEGGAVYALSAGLRDGLGQSPILTLDLAPDRTQAALDARLARPRGGLSLANHLRRSVGLSGVRAGLLRECAPHVLGDPAATAAAIKGLALRLTGPRPLAEAISTAGGVAWQGLTPELMLRARPATFCAGEMIDWEAPTGGYLLTACLATGRRAGEAAAAIL